ncbi:PREDICTED: cationic amino acid transporter 1-like [Prunus mume]|uniref:Cationic amino acid transporter 1-like n=1 Tax=Prunus mume TaxID=102107 RepID=A0ABM0NJA4_PRUMU|nr:PREDICTED: cationic amino acid transporter 1-like [Prunus mume]
MVTGIEAAGGGQGNGIGKRSCFCSKEDFLPEESFKSWGNYVHALANTKTRLTDRILARSMDHQELEQMRARSHNQMKKTLNWWDLIWFGIGAVMGAGIFVLTGQAARNDAGPAVVISYFISGVSELLSVLCYTEFSVELPVAGGSFSYLRVELGDFVAYIAAGNILFEYVVAGASVARSWTSYFATLCNHNPNDFRINVPALADNFNHLDPIAVVISILVCIGAALSMKASSRFNSVTTIVHLVVLVFIFITGMTKANPANFTTNFLPFGFRGVLKASAVLFFAYIGFDGVATLGEEIKNPGRDIPIGLIGSMLVTITTYCVLSATLCLMQPYSQIDADASFTMAFQAAGMNWAKYIVALGAIKGMTTVLLANLIAQARYFTHIGRTHMAPPILASIHPKTGTPVNATVIMTVANSLVALFTSLDVLANLLSISTLFIFSLVSLALIVRRYYVTGETSTSDRNKLIGFLTLIVGSSIATAVYWVLSQGWIGYVVTGVLWFAASLGLQLTLKQAKKPKLWGVPLVPWLPSASIAFNVFILGSIDVPSFIRFAIWTLALLVYYIFVALHASYDAARETDRVEAQASQASQATNMEAGTS